MNYTDEDLDQMPWEDLIHLRKTVGTANQEEQNRVANAEHQAYARERVKENPLQAIVMGAAIPGYQAYKALVPGSRSEGGLAQMGAGYKGVLQGLLARMQR